MSARTQTVTIGRGRDCDLLLTHNSISRKHAELIIDSDGGYGIRDLQSTGGTFLLRGGQEIPVTETKLNPGDTLRFGNYDISLKNLLSLLPEEKPAASRSKRIPAATGGGGGGSGGRSRMMRCACGSIKERGKPCPDCGT